MKADKENKELTMAELITLIGQMEGDFIIRIALGEEDENAEEESF